MDHPLQNPIFEQHAFSLTPRQANTVRSGLAQWFDGLLAPKSDVDLRDCASNVLGVAQSAIEKRGSTPFHSLPLSRKSNGGRKRRQPRAVAPGIVWCFLGRSVDESRSSDTAATVRLRRVLCGAQFVLPEEDQESPRTKAQSKVSSIEGATH